MNTNKKWWVLLSTLVLISLVFLFYFYVYVKKKEKEIIVNNMRVLAQANKNVESRLDNLYRIKVYDLRKSLSGETKKTGRFWKTSTSPATNPIVFKGRHIHFYDSVRNEKYENIQDVDEVFDYPLIHRNDVFDFITIGKRIRKNKSLAILYTNHPAGVTHLEGDSLYNTINTQSLFEMSYGSEDYMVFNLRLNGDEDIFLTGYVNKSKFNDLKREVSVFTITLTTILIILMLLSLPLLKLKIMSNIERLHISDVFLSGVAIVIGASVLLILFLFFSSNQLYERSNQKNKLNQLSDRVSLGFYQELDAMLCNMKRIRFQTKDDLDEYYEGMLENGSVEQPFFDQLDTFKINSDDKLISFKDGHLALDEFGYSNGYFWTNDQGKVKVSMTPLNYFIANSNDLSHRTYVMDIVNGEGRMYKGDSIAIESIRSILDGTYEIGIGMKSGSSKLPVFAQSTTSALLIDPIMEQGYGYCIFDKSGNTLFHSEKARNLNENFLDETQNQFDTYMSSGVSYFTSADYAGSKHYINVQPLEEFDDLYLATFVNHQYVRSPNVIAMNVTIVMQFAFYILLTCFFFILYISTSKRTKLRQKVFPFNWLRPYFSPNFEYQKIYSKLLGANFTTFLFLILVGISVENPDKRIFALIFTIPLSVALHYYVLSLYLPFQKKIYTSFSRTHTPQTFIAIVSGFVLIGGIVFFRYYADSIWEVVVVILYLRLLYHWFAPFRIKASKNNSELDSETFKDGGGRKHLFRKKFRAYKYYAFSWVMLLSVIPTAFFFSINFRKEKQIKFKSNILCIGEKKDHWESTKSEGFFDQNVPKKAKVDDLDGLIGKLDSLRIHLSDTVAYVNLMTKVNLNEKQKNPSAKFVIPAGYYDVSRVDTTVVAETYFLDRYYNNIRFYFDRYGEVSQGYIENQDQQQHWTYLDGSIYLTKKQLRIKSSEQSLQDIINANWWVHVLCVLFLVIIVYRLMEYALHRIFGLDFKNYSDRFIKTKDPEEIVSELKELLGLTQERGDSNADQKGVLANQEHSFHNCLITGVNASHLFRVRERLRKIDNIHYVTVDFFDLKHEDIENTNKEKSDKEQKVESYIQADRLNDIIVAIADLKGTDLEQPMRNALQGNLGDDKKPILVYIEHFEYAYNDLEYNKRKLLILERLVDNPSVRVVISSEIDPKKIYNDYQTNIQQIEHLLTKHPENFIDLKPKLDELKINYKKWMHLMGGFYKIAVPLEYGVEEGGETSDQVIAEELNNGVYLNSLKKRYAESTSRLSAEDYTLNIQELSSSYYFSIWNSLSTEERFIVYDIAKDKFVNTNNVDGIIELLHKGILKYDHSLRLMNESFTNFVLSEVHSNEALERELETRKKGKWNLASAVIILIIVSLVIFVSFGKVSILTDVNALVSSLGAIFALFLRVSGIVSLGGGAK